MPRPLPNSAFLIDLARRLQQTQTRGETSPSLMWGHPQASFAITAYHGAKEIEVVDLKAGKTKHALPLPPKCRFGSDFRAFTFNQARTLMGAYNPGSRTFAVWSLDKGELKNTIIGEGKIPPTIAFLPDNTVAVCDGPKVARHDIGGAQVGFVALADMLRSLLIFPISGRPGVLSAVAVFEVENGDRSIACFQLRSAGVSASGDGPTRAKLPNPLFESELAIREIAPIPGAPDGVFIVLEEERISAIGLGDEQLPDDTFKTRLVALDPVKCQFFRGEQELDGRFCLENSGEELHLVDESGRRRKLEGMPVSIKAIDWRLD